MQRNLRKESLSPKRSAEDKPKSYSNNGASSSIDPKWLSVFAFLGSILFLSLLNLNQLYQIKNDLILDASITEEVLQSSGLVGPNTESAPRVWIYGERMEVGYLEHVIDIFNRIGYRQVNGSAGEEWDVMWSHDYPFGHQLQDALKIHQRVNHFPGCGFITNKASLAISNLLHVPKAFHIPKHVDEFMAYTKQHPEKQWVQKSNAHRGIRVQSIENINLNSTGTFVQEFVKNPLLIDGRKFDIGIYVTLTSLNPLRVYIYDGEALLRFCAQDYLPFDEKNLDSYVVGDNYTPIWEISSLRKYYVDTNLNMKETLNAYLRSKGQNPQRIWQQIEECISSVFIEKEQQMYSMMSLLHMDSRHFFEMMRFDFLVDDELNVYLMEANMSPNLSSLHFRANQPLYEQVIFNVLSLTRWNNLETVHRWPQLNDAFFAYRISDKDLSVQPELCASDRCRLSCRQDECQVCAYCLDERKRLLLKDATMEHLQRYRNKRLLPNLRNLTMNSQYGDNPLHLQWFKGKCLLEAEWC